MDAATSIRLLSRSPAPKPSLSCPLFPQPRRKGHQEEVPLPKLLERQCGDFYPEISLPAWEQCPQCLRSLAPTASTMSLLWHSLLPSLHRHIPASRLFLLTAYWIFLHLLYWFQRHKQGYKTVVGLFYRKENRATSRAGIWFGFCGTKGSPSYPLDVWSVLLHGNFFHCAFKAKKWLDVKRCRLFKASPLFILRVNLSQKITEGWMAADSSQHSRALALVQNWLFNLHSYRVRVQKRLPMRYPQTHI